jgi:hypothetical protein
MKEIKLLIFFDITYLAANMKIEKNSEDVIA